MDKSKTYYILLIFCAHVYPGRLEKRNYYNWWVKQQNNTRKNCPANINTEINR